MNKTAPFDVQLSDDPIGKISLAHDSGTVLLNHEEAMEYVECLWDACQSMPAENTVQIPFGDTMISLTSIEARDLALNTAMVAGGLGCFAQLGLFLTNTGHFTHEAALRAIQDVVAYGNKWTDKEEPELDKEIKSA